MTATKLAEIAQASLTRGERDSDNTYKKIIVRTADAPPWVEDLCRAAGAHSDNTIDWDYEFVEDALSELGNTDEGDWDDVRMDAAEYYPYTRDQLNWLSSTVASLGVCDEAAEEFGGEAGTTGDRMSLGMTLAMNRVLDAVRDFLRDKAEETEEAEEAETI